MTIPIEFLVWGLGVVGLFFSFAIHLLIRINAKISDVATSYKTSAALTDERMASLKLHTERNRQETDWMRRHLRIPEAPLTRQGEHAQ